MTPELTQAWLNVGYSVLKLILVIIAVAVFMYFAKKGVGTASRPKKLTRKERMKHWQKIDARIVSQKFDAYDWTNDEYVDLEMTYTPLLTITYTVNGKRYTKSDVAIGAAMRISEEESKYAMCELFGSNAVPIFVDPNDPESFEVDDSRVHDTPEFER